MENILRNRQSTLVKPLQKLTCAAHAAWAVEHDGILLIDQKKGVAQYIGYPEAMIWDMLVRGRGLDCIQASISAVLALSNEKAGCFLANTVENWKKYGWLE